MRRVEKAAAVMVAFALAGCGGSSGGSSSTSAGGSGTPPVASQTGQFVDEIVEGASYYTSTGSGGCAASTPCTTDANGNFKFAAGDTVTFAALGVKLGSATLAGASDGGVTLVRPNTLTGESSPTGQKAIDVATFLHMVSTQTQNGIQLNTSLGSLTSAVPNGDATQISDFNTLATSIKQSSGVTVSVPVASDILSILTQTATLTAATVSFDDSIWRATCDSGCGGGTFTLTATGEAFGFTDSGELISGTWSVNSDGSVALALVSSGGGSANGTLPAGKTSCTSCLSLTQHSGGATTLSLTEASGGTGAMSVYAGLWYASFTPNTQGAAAGLGTAGTPAGGAVLVAAPDGNVYGMVDNGSFLSGTWTLSNGQGTATVTLHAGSTNPTTATVSFDLSKQSGILSVGGTSDGALAFSRDNGTATAPYFVLHASSGNTIALVLNLQVNWKNAGGSGSGGYSESLALDAHVDDSSGSRLGSLVKPEQTYILFGTANVPPTTDSIAVTYPQGSGATYHVTFGGGGATMTDSGGMTCTIANGTGTVNDAYQGDPSKYPTVTVTCN